MVTLLTHNTLASKTRLQPLFKKSEHNTDIHSPKNHLLAALVSDEFKKLSTHLKLIKLRLGDMLYGPNEQLQYAYFPTSSIISLHYVTESGSSAEMAGVGNEGMVGVPLFLGGDTTPSSGVVITAGNAYQLDRHILKEEFKRAGSLQCILLRYTQALMTQISQTTTCNRHHSVEQQLCRWLLLTIDRIPDHELIMTQELVVSMLGVRRGSVTQAARDLQSAGCINYRRGHITVLDRKKLNTRVCECYGVVKMEMQRLISSDESTTKS